MVSEVARESPGMRLMRNKVKIKKILLVLVNPYMDRFKQSPPVFSTNE
jgi:hypothetical protein